MRISGLHTVVHKCVHKPTCIYAHIYKCIHKINSIMQMCVCVEKAKPTQTTLLLPVGHPHQLHPRVIALINYYHKNLNFWSGEMDQSIKYLMSMRT